MYNDIDKLLIKSGMIVRAAMQQLDLSQKKVLFLIDDNYKLLGSLTDGDVRRWILSGGNLDGSVAQVCNHNPYFVYEGYNKEEVKKEVLKEKHSAIPILDASGKIIDIIFWNDIFEGTTFPVESKLLDIPVVIMAGGQGARLEPFTKILPKPLIPIGDKSIIELIIDKFLDYQVQHFYISINHKAKIIKSYFEELSPSYSVDFIEEKKPLGTIGALAYLKGKIDKPILITNCDIIIDTDYSELLNFHKNNNHDISLVASMIHHKIPYGICEIENGGSLVKFSEKPEFSYLASTGMYIVNYELLELIQDDTFCNITHLIELIRARGGSVGVYPISENSWFDTGEWDEYKKTLERLKV